jgi:AcrR family transcriptional regulator
LSRVNGAREINMERVEHVSREPNAPKTSRKTRETNHSGSKRPKRMRLDPIERKRAILDEAIRFFAEHGLDAQVKDLADQIGVSEGLIFRYFGTKQNLIAAVYRGIGFTSWFKRWEAHLRNRSVSLRDRIRNYYLSYMQTMEDPAWIGITIFATVAARSSSPRMRVWGDRMIAVVAEEVCAHFFPNRKGPISEHDVEMAWHLHSTFTHYFIRKYLYRSAVTADREALVSAVIDNFLAGYSSEKRASGRS